MDSRPSASATRRVSRAVSWLAPAVVCIAFIAGWEAIVRVREIPPYQLPAPSLIARTIIDQWPALAAAWWITVQKMLVALAAAIVVGVALAAAFASSRLLEASFFPYAVILQVTPLVALAPFLVLWVGPEHVWMTQVVCAWIVAFFPILANTTIGLRGADPGLRDLFALYGATPWQRLRWLLAPSALPYFLAGLRISANLALVGAVVAEFVIGPEVDKPGLASTILVSQLRTDAPTMFAALVLVSATGVMTYAATHLLSRLLLGGWHASEINAHD